ncbi:flagellin [Brevundimonas sp. LM2]|uniref:flagellin N-terminal helical domain-containing protein n=1 Tax=Brevundimonas sp. LM2 TaxID=1938605 RepID=UPI000983E309|nr:flagellin [Brevundimonas sp. LM2]AQR61377.1 flagellin [Brevundimonas sp. LM2]
MANSINTNSGAMVALQSLNQTNRDLDVTQGRINTGKNVSSAKDNGAIFAIATGQRAEASALGSVKNSIQRGQSILDVAQAAGETIVAALTEQKNLAVAIGTATGDALKAYVADYNALGSEITKSLAGATFDGVNLFSAVADDSAVSVMTGTKAANTFVLKQGAPSTAPTAAQTAAAAATTVASATAVTVANYAAPTAAELTTLTGLGAVVDGAITAFTATLADFGTKSKSLDRQLTFTSKIQDAIETGVGNLVDADLAKESARLTALQTKQQLGVQALSIANQSSSVLLSLFR